MTLPHFKIYKLDETDYWVNPDLVARAGRLYGVYLVNVNEVTHLCEYQGSYCLWFLETIPENYPDDSDEKESLLEEIQEGDLGTETVVYVHTNQLDKVEPVHVYDPVTQEEYDEAVASFDGDTEKVTRYFIDEYLEEARANIMY
jgi:hypothetical protein